MENNVLNNEEVIETTEEIANVSSGKAIKIAAGVGVTVLVGFVVYKYVGKPMIAKIKAYRERKATEKEEPHIYEGV